MKTFPYPVEDLVLQSITVTCDLERSINLHALSQKTKCIYEPELFPALRLSQYDPLCVNIFSSGKVVILGIKSLDYHELVQRILLNIYLLCYVFFILN